MAKTKTIRANYILSHPRMLTVVINRWGNLEFASAGVLGMLGISANELEGYGWMKIVLGIGQRREMREKFFRLMSGSSWGEQDCFLRRKSEQNGVSGNGYAGICRAWSRVKFLRWVRT